MIFKRFAALIMCVLMLSGCTIGGKQVVLSFVGPFTVFTMGSDSCKKPEALVYFVTYKNIYDKVGETDIFEGDFDVTKLEERIKRSAINHLSEIYMLNLYAKENDIKLDDSEKQKVSQAALEYMDTLSEEQASELGINLKKVRRMYEKYALALKVYSDVLGSVDEEVSDDDARIMDAYVLYVKNKKLYKKITKDLKNGAYFDRLLATYGQKDKGLISFGRGDYPKEVEEAAFKLKDDELTEGIKTEDGYYFVYCVDKYNEELSEENKKKILQERKEELLNSIVNKQGGLYESHLNEKLIKRLPISIEGIESNDFFTIIEGKFSNL